MRIENTRKGALIALGVGIALFLAASYWLYSSYRLGDDTYIYLQFVRNMTTGGEMSFNYGEPTYGFTSVIWLLLLTGTQFIVKNLLLAPIVLDVAVSVFCIVAVWLAARRFAPDDTSFAWTATLVMSIEPNLLKHAYLGMEAPLSGLLTFIVVILYLKERKREGCFPWSALIAGISVLNRPESSIVLFLILIDQRLRGFSWRQSGMWVLCAFLPIAAWAPVAFASFGTIVPNTFLAKGGAYAAFGKFWTNLIDSAIILLPVFGLVYVVLIAQGVAAYRRNGKEWIKEYWLIYAIPIVLILFLCAILSNELVYARYYFLFGPLTVFVALLFLHPSFSCLSVHSRVWFRRFIVLQFIVISLWMGPTSSTIFRSQEQAKEKLISWIRDNTSQKASILTGTIGRIAFDTERRIICWMGIVNPELIGYLKAHRGHEYFERVRPDYVIVMGKTEQDKHDIVMGRRDSIVYSVPVSQRILVRQLLLGGLASDTLYMNVVKVSW